MNISEQIKSDMREALKAREEVRLSVLRNAMSEFTNELVTKGKKPTDEISDADAVTVLKRLAKQRKESAEQFKSADRDDLAKKEEEELTVIEHYLPEQASDEDIEKVVTAKMNEMGVSDKSGMGQLIGAVIKELGGNADGAKVKEIVEKQLS